MNEMHTTNSSRLSLPAIVNASRIDDLEELWTRIEETGADRIDGSPVGTIDSQGLAMLLKGLRAAQRRGKPVTIESPGVALLAARRAFHLQETILVSPEDASVPQVEIGARLGEVLVQMGVLCQEDLDMAVLHAQQRPDTYIGQVLLDGGHITEVDLARALAAQHGLPFVDANQEGCLDVSLDCDVPFAELRVHGILPYLRLEDTVAIALKDPADVYAADVVRKHTGLKVMTTVATPEAIHAGLDQVQRAAASKGAGAEAGDDDFSAEERFNEIVTNAIIEGASDIHLEPFGDHYSLRYRVDGRLHEVAKIPQAPGSSLTARIKVTAGADISEKRLPQDGRIHFEDRQRDVDLRVNTLPTVYGEKTVMRILDRTAKALSIKQLGIKGRPGQWLEEAIHLPHGMVLVTGPTGSGKTTTLYSVLDEIVSPETNVSTVENPVERSVDGVNQTQVNHKAGLSFELCLRALLRQDPDVIMIGEIRDKETAEIAVEAALTGHLVLATLHTNDAPGAASRLIQMGVEPFLVAATLRCVVAQRLVRKLCENCKRLVHHPDEVLAKYTEFGLDKNADHYSSSGCLSCRQTGYDGRRGVFEVMKVHSNLQDLIARNPSTGELRKAALELGMASLMTDALDRVNIGITTLEEALRAGGGEE